jgi:aspartate ammonia-lyase
VSAEISGAPGERLETDLLGERRIPADALWGIHTLRATENFAVSGVPVGAHRVLVRALAQVKQAAASANLELGLIEADVAAAINHACEEVARGDHDAQFTVDVLQGGAGTSTNMNANEVIANRAAQLLGYRPGRHDIVDPHEHVNLGQSTNDVYPTALRLAVHAQSQPLLDELGRLADTLEVRSRDFARHLKVGRTQLQDAVPMTLGQEFGAAAHLVRTDRDRIHAALSGLCAVNLGGTAIGTGLNAPAGYARRAVEQLSRLSGLPVRPADDLVAATQDCAPFADVSSALRQVALRLSKLSSDLRLLASGPRAGFAEINLPPRQAGSSIMPGKVNPVIPEMLNQVCFEAVGNDVTVAMAVEAGQLQLNAFEPLIGHVVLTGLQRMSRAVHALRVHCCDGITANVDHLGDQVRDSIGLATGLNPLLGYAASTAVAREALSAGTSVPEVVLSRQLGTEAQIAELLSPERLAGVLPAARHNERGSVLGADSESEPGVSTATP